MTKFDPSAMLYEGPYIYPHGLTHSRLKSMASNSMMISTGGVYNYLGSSWDRERVIDALDDSNVVDLRDFTIVVGNHPPTPEELFWSSFFDVDDAIADCALVDPLHITYFQNRLKRSLQTNYWFHSTATLGWMGLQETITILMQHMQIFYSSPMMSTVWEFINENIEPLTHSYEPVAESLHETMLDMAQHGVVFHHPKFYDDIVFARMKKSSSGKK